MSEKVTDTSEKQVEVKKSHKKYYAVFGTVAVIAASLFAYRELSAPNSADTPQGSSTPVEQSQRCADTWEMTGLGHANGDWTEESISETGPYGDKLDARTALDDWLNEIKADNSTLEYLAEAVHRGSDKITNDIDPTALVAADSCATNLAVNQIDYIRQEFASANVYYDLAPPESLVSFVDGHNEIKLAGMPADANRASITVDFKNNNFLYILESCGNLIIYEAKSAATIEKAAPPSVTTIVKKKTIIIENDCDDCDNKTKNSAKKSSEDASSKGKAPKGSGSNQDKGSGQYEEATKPETKQKPESDAPKPEQSAPSKNAPATGVSSVPGI